MCSCAVYLFVFLCVAVAFSSSNSGTRREQVLLDQRPLEKSALLSRLVDGLLPFLCEATFEKVVVSVQNDFLLL